MLIEDSPEHVYIAQTGLIGEGLPNHTANTVLAECAMTLTPDKD